MPWKASSVMDERMRFVLEHERGLYTMTDLCEIYEIARETGYYWLRRYQQGGLEALQDRNRAPERHPNQTPERDRRGGAGAAASAHELGSAKTETRIGAGNSADAVAGGEHHRCACWRGKGWWCRARNGGAHRPTLSRLLRPMRPTACGAPISKAGSERKTANASIR